MEINNVRVKSMARARVGMMVPELNLRRSWARKGAVQVIPMDLLEQAIYTPGVEYMFKAGILHIDDKTARIALGLEAGPDAEEMGVEVKPIVAMTDEYAKELLFKKPLKEFREIVEGLSDNQAQELCSVAIENKLTDYQRCKILQEKTEKDVLKIVIRMSEEEAHDNA